MWFLQMALIKPFSLFCRRKSHRIAPSFNIPPSSSQVSLTSGTSFLGFIFNGSYALKAGSGFSTRYLSVRNDDMNDCMIFLVKEHKYSHTQENILLCICNHESRKAEKQM